MTPIVQYAHSYLAAQLPVIALTGKRPNTKFHPQGLNGALAGVPENEEDNALIDQVFNDPTTTGIGIVIPAQLVVVDIDGPEGVLTYAKLTGMAEGELPPTGPIAMTGRGLHLWYMTTTARRSTKLGPLLDLKGLGGYVAAPPSAHYDKDDKPDGLFYRWLDPLVDAESGMLTPVDWLPAGIEEFLKEADRLENDRAARDYTPDWGLNIGTNGWTIQRQPASITGLVKAVREAGEGNRNNILAWAAMTARDQGVPRSDAETELSAAAKEAGLTAQESRTTIRAAYRRSK